MGSQTGIGPLITNRHGSSLQVKIKENDHREWSSMETSSAYFDFLIKRFQGLDEGHRDLVSDRLISPFTIDLPSYVLDQAKNIVASLYEQRESVDYQSRLGAQGPEVLRFDPRNKSICMSYDFHLSENKDLKLIEVNTNAAFLLMGHLLYQCKNLPFPVANFDLEVLKKAFLEEARLTGHTIKTIAIVDEEPENQRLYIEFLLYQELFREFGWEPLICDPSQLRYEKGHLFFNNLKIDFVYNRSTDFLLEKESHQALKQAYLEKAITLSPNPHEYFLLADKSRLLEWSQAELPIHRHLLKAQMLTESNASDIWKEKKSYFFKPLQSFGSKGSYRGEGISRNYFDQLIGQNVLAQEFCPAPQEVFEDRLSKEKIALKYDLRFYAYKGDIQTVIARLYQGQVTNLKTPQGGFAPVCFANP